MYASGEIAPGSLAPRKALAVRRAPSFQLASDWVNPKRRYCATTLAAYLGEKYTATFLATLDLLAAHENGEISQEVFDAIVSGEKVMSSTSLIKLTRSMPQ
jgi:hypothetical protein